MDRSGFGIGLCILLVPVIIGIAWLCVKSSQRSQPLGKPVYWQAKAKVWDARGHLMHCTYHGSNSDACEALAETFHLTDEEHQLLWDNLAFNNENYRMEITEA